MKLLVKTLRNAQRTSISLSTTRFITANEATIHTRSDRVAAVLKNALLVLVTIFTELRINVHMDAVCGVDHRRPAIVAMLWWDFDPPAWNVEASGIVILHLENSVVLRSTNIAPVFGSPETCFPPPLRKIKKNA